MKKYYLTGNDVKGLKRELRKLGAGKGVLSKRPVPTRRRRIGGGSVRYVAITDSFDGATWDGDEITEETITVYGFNGSAPNEDDEMEVTVGLGLDSPRTITAGKFIRGIVIGGQLIQAQCPEWDLPEGWGES